MSEGMKARVVKEIDFQGEPGDIEFVEDRKGVLHSIIACCPRCAIPCVLPIRTNPPHGWSWNGSKESPTLQPSIHHNNGSCGWHGYLKDGEFVPC